ncbi:hypothetical protein ACWGR4_21450 [Embleya sp. NPDC055664]
MTPTTAPCGGTARLDLLRHAGSATVRVTLAVERCRRACARQRG